jgi:hypothetical protein
MFCCITNRLRRRDKAAARGKVMEYRSEERGVRKKMTIIKSIKFLIVLILLLFGLPAGKTDKDTKGLIIDGKNFRFMVHEPDNWKAEIEDAKAKGLNAYFTPDGYTWKNSPAVIYIRVMEKYYKDVGAHLSGDMDQYKNDKTKIIFKDFKPGNLKYKNYTKQYLINDKTCDYLCYLDPGAEFDTYVMFVLATDKTNCDKYFTVFQSLLRSFTWGGDKVKTPKQ